MILGMPITDKYDWYIGLARLYAAMIQCRVHFGEASYGDGEFKCIMGHKGETARGQVYNDQLQKDLIETMMEPAGQWFCYWGNNKPLRKECDAWLEKHQPPGVWLPRRVVAAANCHGHLGDIFRAIRSRNTLLVGPAHFKDLPDRVIGQNARIEIHGTEAWKHIDEVCSEVSVEVASGKIDLVIFAAGMAAPVMVHRLMKEFRGKATFWDVGAIFDPYCGVFLRKHYRLKEWQENVMWKNVE